MDVNDILEQCVSGECCFKIGDRLFCATSDIPNGYGVYCIYANSVNGELLYIGKGGTINFDGTFKGQQLRKRLNNSQHKQRRENYFVERMKSEHLGILIIKWYILKDSSILPAFLEAMLIQAYFEKNKKLPRWNKSF